MFLSLRNIFLFIIFFFFVWYKARNKRVFKYVYLSGEVIFFFLNITLICKYVWSFQILYLFESVWLEIKDISNRNIKWWNEFHSSVLFTLLWLKICCLQFLKEKPTNNFQMNYEKKIEILNDSIYHDDVYFNFI